MRHFLTIIAAFLSLCLVGPVFADTPPIGGEIHGLGGSGQVHHTRVWNVAYQVDSWLGGYSWGSYPSYGRSYTGYGDRSYRYSPSGQYGYATVYVPPRGPSVSRGTIHISNPAESAMSLNYTLNGVPFRLRPGQSQDLTADRPWVIAFDRGSAFGAARYGLHSGFYAAARTDRGWELYRTPWSTQGAAATASRISATSPPAAVMPKRQ